MNGYATAGTFEWLERVLAERFGHPFRLQATATGHHRLCLEGQPRCVLIESAPAMFDRRDSDLPSTTWDAHAEGWEGPVHSILPAPGAASLQTPLISATEDGYEIAYDILGLTCWMLARREEVGRTDLDEHGRFPARASHAFKHDYLLRPIIDEWLHVLGQVIARTWPGIELARHEYRLRVTHDVDRPSRYGFGGFRHLLRAMAGDIAKRGQLKTTMRAPWIWSGARKALHPADPYNTFDWLMDLSEANGLQSAFYFICGRTDPARDANYEITDPAIRALMRRIHARGHEIGLHPSYGTYLRPDLLAQEALRLRETCEGEGIEQSAWGGRMHYLRWRQPETMRAWADAGMAYDGTLGYADHVGFRCGTCHEYPAFDPVAKQEISLRIRPLIAMEGTVLSPKYMGHQSDDSISGLFSLLSDRCAAVEGEFSLLWHNSEFQEERQVRIYADVVTGRLATDQGQEA